MQKKGRRERGFFRKTFTEDHDGAEQSSSETIQKRMAFILQMFIILKKKANPKIGFFQAGHPEDASLYPVCNDKILQAHIVKDSNSCLNHNYLRSPAFPDNTKNTTQTDE